MDYEEKSTDSGDVEIRSVRGLRWGMINYNINNIIRRKSNSCYELEQREETRLTLECSHGD